MTLTSPASTIEQAAEQIEAQFEAVRLSQSKEVTKDVRATAGNEDVSQVDTFHVEGTENSLLNRVRARFARVNLSIKIWLDFTAEEHLPEEPRPNGTVDDAVKEYRQETTVDEPLASPPDLDDNWRYRLYSDDFSESSNEYWASPGDLLYNLRLERLRHAVTHA